MARVYLARDLRYDKPVALKVLSPELSAALGTERFLREIHIVAHLNHPHILPLLDSGEAEGKLFYVMPYVAAGSLRNRLRRETQLSIEDAIAITRDVAGALDHAHRQGFVHRDVKPENILMSEGLAIVADFGIARAITLASGDDDRITQSGVSPGTPPYMSPEQASGAEVDGRSDEYALGCVLYEMLAGQPPFTGPTTQAILARHLADPVPPLRSVRKTVSEGLERVVLKSLEKVPADRFATAGEFAATLTSSAVRTPVTPWWRRPVAVSLMLLAAAVGGLSLLKTLRTATSSVVNADSTRYAILPFERDAGIASLNEDQLLQDALARWSGISIVDPFQVRDAMAQLSGSSLSTSKAQRIAALVKSGRYVRGEVSRAGDSLRVYAGVYDATKGGALVHEGSVKVGPTFNNVELAFARLSDLLLFGDADPGVRPVFQTGTRSRPARQAFASALAAIQQWDLAAADSGFAAASLFDPDYAEAFLWLAQVRAWTGAPVATWQSAAERAAARRQNLTSRDQLLSSAVVSLARGDASRACRLWDLLARREENDFTAWYGLGNCLSNDSAVIRDRTSPSGWSFRSSYQQATLAYVRAFQLLPSMHRALRRDSYDAVRRLLKTDPTSLRGGQALPPETTRFVAYPIWQAETLAFIPYPADKIVEPSWTLSAATNIAARRERELFHQIAAAWIAAFPRSVDAIQALALSLQMLGDPSALDTLRRARQFAQTPDEKLRVGAAEVWMRIQFSAPMDLAGVRVARALADSLLSLFTATNGPDPISLASLAALTGRADLAAAYLRAPSVAGRWVVPAVLAQSGPQLLVYAAMGGPVDSLQRFDSQVDSTIENALPNPLRGQARLRWLARSSSLSFPEYHVRSLFRLTGIGDYLVDAQGSLLHGDTAAVRRVFADLRAARRSFPPSQVSFDALYPEARLLVALGDSQMAREWLDPPIGFLATAEPQGFLDPVAAGALVRAIALRAELSGRNRDNAQTRKLAETVVVLWSEADAFLQPTVREMRALAGLQERVLKLNN